MSSPLFPIALLLALGIWLADALPPAGVGVWAVGGLLLMAVHYLMRSPRARSAVLLLAVVAVGGMRMALWQRTTPTLSVRGPLRYTAVVATTPQASQRGLRCDLDIISTPRPLRVRATFPLEAVDSLVWGHTLAIHSLLRPVSMCPDYPHFQYRRWLQTHGYQAVTYIRADQWRIAQRTGKDAATLRRCRMRLLRWLHDTGINAEALSLVAAMTLGDRSLLSEETRLAYSVSGGSHVLALSGLHLGIIYMVVVSLISWIVALVRPYTQRSRPWPWLLLTQAISLPAIWVYAALVGTPASVVRAATMITVYGLTTLTPARRQPVQALSIAATAILLCSPLSLWDVGFQMSFMAMLAILLLTPRMGRHGWLWGIVCMTLAAQVGVMPLVMYYFGRIPCYFLLTSLLVVPLTTLLLYLFLLLCATLPLAVVCEPLTAPLSWTAHALTGSAEWVASLPGASIEGAYISPLQVALLYLITGCLWAVWKKKTNTYHHV